MSVKKANLNKSLAFVAVAMLSVFGAGAASAQQYAAEAMLEATLQEKAETRQAEAERKADNDAAKAEQNKADRDPA